MKDKSKPIRVLHIVGGVMDVGGIEMFLMNYYRHIDRNVIQFDFCIVEEGDGHFDEEIRGLGGVIYNLPSKKRHPIKHLKSLLKVLRHYRNYPVHMHLDGMNGLYGLIALINKNQIRISHSHNTNHLTNNIVKRLIHDFFRLLNRAVNNKFAACSNEACLWLHGIKKAQEAILIRNAINTKNFEFSEALREQYREYYGITDEIVIGHVGRFDPQKNHDFILQIANELKNKSFNFKFIFIGDGVLFERINSKVKMLKLDSKVIFVGKTKRPNIYYHMMDLFILPSNFEGLGISLVEAQVNGLNCIVSDEIPDEAVISENVKKLPLGNSENWANNIIQANTSRVFNLIESYEIEKNKIILETYYRSLFQIVNCAQHL
jgi:glycosyltransferase involved in cell wall biosynthesis